MNKTERALARMALNPNLKPYPAALAEKLSPSTLYRAIKREKARVRCPCCGQSVK